MGKGFSQKGWGKGVLRHKNFDSGALGQGSECQSARCECMVDNGFLQQTRWMWYVSFGWRSKLCGRVAGPILEGQSSSHFGGTWEREPPILVPSDLFVFRMTRVWGSAECIVTVISHWQSGACSCVCHCAWSTCTYESCRLALYAYLCVKSSRCVYVGSFFLFPAEH